MAVDSRHGSFAVFQGLGQAVPPRKQSCPAEMDASRAWRGAKRRRRARIVRPCKETKRAGASRGGSNGAQGAWFTAWHMERRLYENGRMMGYDSRHSARVVSMLVAWSRRRGPWTCLTPMVKPMAMLVATGTNQREQTRDLDEAKVKVKSKRREQETDGTKVGQRIGACAAAPPPPL